VIKHRRLTSIVTGVRGESIEISLLLINLKIMLTIKEYWEKNEIISTVAKYSAPTLNVCENIERWMILMSLTCSVCDDRCNVRCIMVTCLQGKMVTTRRCFVKLA
jgi:hypothetical protein